MVGIGATADQQRAGRRQRSRAARGAEASVCTAGLRLRDGAAGLQRATSSHALGL